MRGDRKSCGIEANWVIGFVGLNNIKANDYLNVVAHALAHVVPLRNYMMLEDLKFKPELGMCSPSYHPLHHYSHSIPNLTIPSSSIIRIIASHSSHHH